MTLCEKCFDCYATCLQVGMAGVAKVNAVLEKVMLMLNNRSQNPLILC